MKRAALLAALLALAVGVFALCHLAGTYRLRQLRHDPAGEIAWLAHEYRLTPPQTARIAALHAAYAPRCEAMCGRIEENNRQLDALLTAGPARDAEIAVLLRDSAQIQVDCRTEMLAYLRAVAAEMPPEQAARYLAAMKPHVLQPGLPHSTAGMHAHEH